MSSIISTIILLISLNLAPQNATEITIKIPNEKESIVLVKDKNGIWTVKGEGVLCSATSTKFTFQQGENKQTVSITEHINLKGEIDWKNVKKFSMPKDMIDVQITKSKNGVTVLCSKKGESKKEKIEITWKISKKENSSSDNK